MRFLLQWISLRHLLYERRAWLTFIGVAIGISVFVSIRIANTSVLNAYQRSVDAVAGKTTLEVTRPVGELEETTLIEVRKSPGILYSAPVVQAILPITSPSSATGEVLWIIGVDLLQEGPFREYELIDVDHVQAPLDIPGRLNKQDRKGALQDGARDVEAQAFEALLDPSAILLTEKFAARRRIALGEALAVRKGETVLHFQVKGLLKAKGPAEAQDGNIAIIDIAAAQWRFGKLGKLDRIDLITDNAVPTERVIEQLMERLGGNIVVRRPEQRSAQVEKMLAAFQLNLTALSAISLFVGIFLIYNTLLVSVVHRRKEIGVLRALGVSRNRIFWLFALEGILIGGAGGIVGVLAGALLARSVLQLIARTVSALYVSIPPSPFALPPSAFLEGIGVGVVVATLSSFFPALQAGRLRPREAMEGVYASTIGARSATLRRPSNHWRFLIAGFSFGLLSFLLSKVPTGWNLPVAGGCIGCAGYLSAATLLIAFSLIVPSTIRLFCWGTRPLLPRLRPTWRLAQGHLQQAIHRNGPTIAAFMGALAMMISVVIMIESFRGAVTLWIDQTIKADLIVAPVSLLSKESEETLPETLLTEIPAAPGVEAVDGYRSVRIQFRNEPAILVGRNLSVHAAHSRFLFKSGASQEVLQRAIREKQVLISEVFANRFHLHEGETIEIPSPKGPIPFEIGGIFYEYATDGGKMVLDRSILKERWGEDRINVVGVYLKKGFSPDAVRQGVVQAFGDRYGLTIVTQVSFKKEILKIFDQTFLITYALEWIAIVVALIGIANTLFVSVLEQRREIGILRAIGASERQVTEIVMIEALFMGLIGYILSVFCALFLSLLLIFVINKQSFGWTLLFHFPRSILLHSFLLATLTALVAGYLPARQAARLQVTEAIAYE